MNTTSANAVVAGRSSRELIKWPSLFFLAIIIALLAGVGWLDRLGVDTAPAGTPQPVELPQPGPNGSQPAEPVGGIGGPA